MKQITIDGKKYNLTPVEPIEPLICTLDGYQYFLGPQADDPLTWIDANLWRAALGDNYELPDRRVLLACYMNANIRNAFAAGVYWSSTEFSSSFAWCQTFGYGDQYTNVKGNACYVRAVRRLPI